MSGTANVKPPKNDAEWARNTERRLAQTEHPSSARVGNWVLSTHPDTGDLIASNVNGGSLILAEQPEPSDTPDTVTSPACAVVVGRSSLQSIPSGGAYIDWDSTLAEVGGEWGAGSGTVSELTVPQSGLYQIAASIHWQTGGITATAAILVDDRAVLSSRITDGIGSAWITSQVNGLRSLQQGSVVQMAVSTGGGNAIGASPLTVTPVPSQLSLVRVG
ncbi:hypothetical protein [Nocardia sp. NPDC047654]|uniref:hypothetical protein n=1 Tax=Nocardia sp. NPDC047654 TaxID=3364314 RepID=UPI0037139F91